MTFHRNRNLAGLRECIKNDNQAILEGDVKE